MPRTTQCYILQKALFLYRKSLVSPWEVTNYLQIERVVQSNPKEGKELYNSRLITCQYKTAVRMSITANNLDVMR